LPCPGRKKKWGAAASNLLPEMAKPVLLNRVHFDPKPPRNHQPLIRGTRSVRKDVHRKIQSKKGTEGEGPEAFQKMTSGQREGVTLKKGQGG